MSSEITLVNHFPALAATLPLAVGKIIRKTAFDIQAQAMINAPIKTGFLRSSIYVTGKDYDTYGQNLTGIGALLPRVPKPESWTHVIVAVGAAYGMYVEMGTRYKPAKPFLIPAAEKVKPQLAEALAQLEAFWIEAGGLL